MDITVRKNYNHHDKITKKEIRNYFRVGSYVLLFFVFLLTYFFLQDENLHILGSSAYKVVVRKIALGGVFTFLILVLKNLAERLIVKRSKAPAYYNPLRVLRLASILLILISIISTFFVNWYTAAVSLGVISLILSFSLQNPLTSLIGWVYILMRSPSMSQKLIYLYLNNNHLKNHDMKITSVLFHILLLVLITPLSFTHVKATPLSVTIYTSHMPCNGGNSGWAAASVSGGTYPYTYLWSTTPSQTTATATGLSVGTYTVAVVDASFNTASTTITITQPPIFTATTSTINNTSCASPNGEAIGIGSGGTPPYWYMWEPMYVLNDTDTGLTPGTYTCIAYDNNGCNDTTTVVVGGTPAPFLTISSTSTYGNLCLGTITSSVSGGTAPYTYLWSPGGYTSANLNNLCASYYCCTVTDNSGCTNYNCVDMDTLANCTNNYTQPICIVTLDTATNKCEIVWGRTNSPPAGGYGYFNIYRDTGAGYSMIHSQALNVLSEYIDIGSNPSAGTVSYELGTVDSCGTSTLSSPHTSIYLTTTAGVNVYILNWTAYVGFTPTEYIIYRGPSLSSLASIDTVSNATFTFHDTLPPLGSYYVVEAVNPNGPCVPTTHSAGKSSFSLLSGAFSNGFNTGTLLGINNLESKITNLNVYPNPSNGIFTLSYLMIGSDNITINIINELGQVVYIEQKNVNTGPHTEQLNAGNLASGIYSLRVQTNTGTSVRKLLIMQNK